MKTRISLSLFGFSLSLSLFLFLSVLHAQDSSLPEEINGYVADILGNGFVASTIPMEDDYEGDVVCTLVRTVEPESTDKAVLYVHGYNDYFFQSELAAFFVRNGYRFYAVDLRKYGRSKREHQYPFMVRDLNEYFADLDSAIVRIKREGIRHIGLMAHSTGGLITSLYAQERRMQLPFFAMVLNSPFLDMNLTRSRENFSIPLVSGLAVLFPKMKLNGGMSTAYAESLLEKYQGEWQFDTAWKYPLAPKLTASWIRAIHKGHKKLQKGLDIPCPILVCHSHRSIYGEQWTPDHQDGDAVLDVEDIEKYGKRLGPKARTETFKGGLHDLALSRKEVREKFYRRSLEFYQNAQESEEYRTGKPAL